MQSLIQVRLQLTSTPQLSVTRGQVGTDLAVSTVLPRPEAALKWVQQRNGFPLLLMYDAP